MAEFILILLSLKPYKYLSSHVRLHTDRRGHHVLSQGY